MKLQCCICKKLSHDVELNEYVPDWTMHLGKVYCPEHGLNKEIILDK